VIEVPAGEEAKEWEILHQVLEQLMEDKADKKSWLINIGGGVITDLGGLVASLYKRGISFIHIPTSLMGMIDASVGGKNGINFCGSKNMIGTFQEPDALLLYPGFLDTLPEKEILSGFAEMIKHALIADESLWEAIMDLEEIDATHLKSFIRRNIQIKNQIVFDDPFEEDKRKLLNYGHTFAHAFEAWAIANKKDFSHGYCVAQGMKLANFIAMKMEILDTEIGQEINEFLEEIFPILHLPTLDELMGYLSQDKKREGAILNYTVLESIGKAKFNYAISLTDWQSYYQEWRLNHPH
jgi:3-dehydroquinate synthase